VVPGVPTDACPGCCPEGGERNKDVQIEEERRNMELPECSRRRGIRPHEAQRMPHIEDYVSGVVSSLRSPESDEVLLTPST
uniref:Uncharacterized protein n=1 Tax=Anopheles dirus TaxID=7168 RepID=A0A182MZI0_9DIPT